MPQYFFHFCNGDDRAEDDSGLEFASAEQAYLEAFAAARAMWPELLTDRQDPTQCAFEIADAGGELLFRLDFSEALEVCRKPGAKPASEGDIVLLLSENHRKASNAHAELRMHLGVFRERIAESHALLKRLQDLEGVPRGKAAFGPGSSG